MNLLETLEYKNGFQTINELFSKTFTKNLHEAVVIFLRTLYNTLRQGRQMHRTNMPVYFCIRWI